MTFSHHIWNSLDQLFGHIFFLFHKHWHWKQWWRVSRGISSDVGVNRKTKIPFLFFNPSHKNFIQSFNRDPTADILENVAMSQTSLCKVVKTHTCLVTSSSYIQFWHSCPHITKKDKARRHAMQHQPAAVVKSKLTAVFQQQRAEGNLHVAGEARHHLVVHVSAAAEVPLLKPVEVAGAGQRVVPQDAAGRKQGNGRAP